MNIRMTPGRTFSANKQHALRQAEPSTWRTITFYSNLLRVPELKSYVLRKGTALVQVLHARTLDAFKLFQDVTTGR